MTKIFARPGEKFASKCARQTLLEYDVSDNDQNVLMTNRWLMMVAGVLVLKFTKGWPRAWHWTGALPVAVSHASS